jgi:hypothetical protein
MVAHWSRKLSSAAFCLAMLSASPSFAVAEEVHQKVQPGLSDQRLVIASANQEALTYRVVRLFAGRNIMIKSLTTGREFDVYYSSSISPEVGDLVTVTFDGDRWISISNHRTNKSAIVTNVSRR